MSRIPELEAMLDENPEDPFLIYALAREYEKAASTMQALLMYEHLINEHPDYIGTYYHYAKILYQAGNRPEGIKMLERGIETGSKLNEQHAVSEMRSLLAMWTGSDEDEED
jgi:tetratricopeptide (TPR) repeat protein